MTINPLLIQSITTNQYQRQLLSISFILTDDDILPLCNAIAKNTSIQRLDLSRNPQLTIKGVQTLVNHFPLNIKVLWLLGSNIDEQGANLLRRLKLDELDLRQNPLSQKREEPRHSTLSFFDRGTEQQLSDKERVTACSIM
jgi:hypothetical protein